MGIGMISGTSVLDTEIWSNVLYFLEALPLEGSLRPVMRCFRTSRSNQIFDFSRVPCWIFM